jgi:hypothetical protein
MVDFRQKVFSREEEGNLVRRMFESAGANILYNKWRKKAIRAFGMYQGSKDYHFTPNELQELWGRGQYPYVVNKLRAVINQCSSVEIISRSRYAFRTFTSKDENNPTTKLVTGMTHLGYGYQEREDTAEYTSLKYQDGLICGLGWSNMFSDDGWMRYQWGSPLNQIYDANDMSPFLTNGDFHFTLHWIGKEQAKRKWPKHAKQLDEYFGKRIAVEYSSYSAEFLSNISPYVGSAMVTNAMGGKILVIECQRKVNRKYYYGIDSKTGYEFQTFKEEDAEGMDPVDNDIGEKEGHEVIRTVICADIVLDYAPLAPHIPNQSFSYVPYVYSRRRLDGIPIGLVDSLISAQKLYNRQKIDEDNSRSGMTVIANEDSFNGSTPDQVRHELSQTNKILLERNQGDIKIIPNSIQADANIKGMQRLDQEFDYLSGMFAESRGEQTNASSGKAMETRVINSTKSQSVSLSGLVLMKKREGRVFLDILQGGAFEDIESSIINEEDREVIYMNVVRTRNGKKEIMNDIRTLPLDVYVENTHDYESESEEDMAIARFALENPQVLQYPELLGLMKARNSGKFIKKLKGIMAPPQQGSGESSQGNGQQPMQGQVSGAQSPMQQIIGQQGNV